MLSRIRSILAPPVFEDDVDKTRTAKLLNIILWCLLLIILAASPGLIGFNVTATDVLISTVLIGIFALSMAGLIWIHRRGHVRAAGTLLCVLLTMAITATIGAP